MTTTTNTHHDTKPKPAKAARARWAGATLLTTGAFLASTGALTPAPAQAVITHQHNDMADHQGCNFQSPTPGINYVGCFDSTSRIIDLTTGATHDDGGPVHPGDILQYTYTLTNNTTTTITDLSLYGTIPKHDCSPDPVCVYDPNFDIKNDWYTNSGLDPYSLRIEGDADVNTGHLQGTMFDHGLEIIGQAGHLRPGATADFRGYLPPGATTTTSFQIQVPYNAPIGSYFGMTLNYTRSDVSWGNSVGGGMAGYAQVDAPPTPEPTATATATITASPEPTPTATVTAEPTGTATPSTTATPTPSSTVTPTPVTTAAVPTQTTTATPTTQAATPTPAAPAVSVPGSPTPPPSTSAPAADAATSAGPSTDAGTTTQALASTGTPGNTIWIITAGALTAAAGIILILSSRNGRTRNH